MYKLLIVDDEAFIADGLYRTFSNLTELPLDVYRCYLASSALTLLDQYRMDIVITDINMPGLSGLDMLKEIQSRWPDCRTIVLSGYSEFDYAQTALRYGADYYVLKSEGDEALIDAVKGCIEKIDAAMKALYWKADMEKALEKAMPLLRQSFLGQLLDGSVPAKELTDQSFQRLQLPLSYDSPLHLAAARLDTLEGESWSSPDTYYCTAIDSIFRHTTAARLTSAQFVLENSRYMVWLIQAKNPQSNPDHIFSYINGALESVQSYCRYALKLSVSFLLEPEAVTFDTLPACYQNLHFVLLNKLNATEEMVLGNTVFYRSPAKDPLHTSELLVHINKLSQLLEFQNKKEFLALFQKLLEKMMDYSNTETQVLLYHNLSAILLNHIIQAKKYDDFVARFQSISIFSLPREQWNISLYEKFLDIAAWIFSADDMESSLRYTQTLHTIHTYIDQHLAEPISLAELAEQVYLNPVYLSRAYKQITGQNISKYIADRRLEKARSLLTNSTARISEIAGQIGYESPAHFSRTFKKSTGMTPQEYRDRYVIT